MADTYLFTEYRSPSLRISDKTLQPGHHAPAHGKGLLKTGQGHGTGAVFLIADVINVSQMIVRLDAFARDTLPPMSPKSDSAMNGALFATAPCCGNVGFGRRKVPFAVS